METQTGSNAPYSLNDIIRLNVGGKRFDTTLRTLLSDKNHELYDYFSILLVNGMAPHQLPQQDDTGAFFLDQDPQLFKINLSNLRHSSHSNQKKQSTVSELSDDEGKPSKPPGFWQKLRHK